MVSALEAAGHECTLFLFDVPGGLASDHEKTVRAGWPQVKANVRDIKDLASMQEARNPGVDVAVATSWESAHILATYGTAPMRRFYFVQDFEPMFYPRGTEYQLALDTYRFGFRHIALGAMIKDQLRAEVGVHSDEVPFGCDTSTYFLIEPEVRRSGVVWYARPGNPRRGYWLARLALSQFHQEHPEVPIFVYGSALRDLPFSAEVYPHLSPHELNELYNRSLAGLSLSFTNVSLVPTELMRAGVIPVVNDSPEPRAVLDSPFVEWAFPTPAALANALGRVVAAPDTTARGRQAAQAMSIDWQDTQAAVVRLIENDTYGVTSGSPTPDLATRW
ncbi:MAG TPA: glycosyltransferase family 1 protein [Microlunatus sp.]